MFENEDLPTPLHPLQGGLTDRLIKPPALLRSLSPLTQRPGSSSQVSAHMTIDVVEIRLLPHIDSFLTLFCQIIFDLHHSDHTALHPPRSPLSLRLCLCDQEPEFSVTKHSPEDNSSRLTSSCPSKSDPAAGEDSTKSLAGVLAALPAPPGGLKRKHSSEEPSAIFSPPSKLHKPGRRILDFQHTWLLLVPPAHSVRPQRGVCAGYSDLVIVMKYKHRKEYMRQML